MAIRSWISSVSVSLSSIFCCLKIRKTKAQTESSEQGLPTYQPQELHSVVYEAPPPPQLQPRPPPPPIPKPLQKLLQGLSEYQLKSHREIGDIPSTPPSNPGQRPPNRTFVKKRPCDFYNIPGTRDDFNFDAETLPSSTTAYTNPHVQYPPAPPSPGGTSVIDPTTSERVRIRRSRSKPVHGPRPQVSPRVENLKARVEASRRPRPQFNPSVEMLEARVEVSRRPRPQLSPSVEVLKARVEASRRHLTTTPRRVRWKGWDRGEMQEVPFSVGVKRKDGVVDLRAMMLEGEGEGVVRVLS